MLSQTQRPSKVPIVLGLYTLVTYALQYTFTGILVLIGILISYFNWKWLIREGHRFWAWGIFLLLGKRVNISGKENYDPTKSYILVANHTSIYDIPAIMIVVAHLSWIGREYLIRIWGFGRLLRMNNFIPIEPSQPDRSRLAIQQAIEKAKHGITVGIFPEGTRTLTGEMGRFKKGFIHILRAAELDILPITLNGFFSLKPKNRFTIDPRPKLEIVIQPALRCEELLPLTDQEIIDIVKHAVSQPYCYR
jgi:1-acyl-sn-glycerol-3-phosphate acyltransferase